MKLSSDIKISYRILALLLSMALMISCLGACGDDNDKKPDSSKSKSTQEKGDKPDESTKKTADTTGKTAADGTKTTANGTKTQKGSKKTTAKKTPARTTKKQTTARPALPPPAPNAPYAAPVIYSTVASGTVVYSNEKATIDASNTSDGYIMARYTGGASKVKLRIINGTTYTYDLSVGGNYEVFPLSLGSGSYTIEVLENISGQSYGYALSTNISVSLSSSFAPFLRPNQFVNYNGNTSAVLKAAELCTGYSADLQKLDRIYNFVINNFTYDNNKANTVKGGYIPDLNSVYAQRRGICSDYSALMAAMLRSQNIPCKVVVGWAASNGGNLYHAWINVYIRNAGWINGAIYFDGQSWKLMDPTFASSGKSSASIMNYINNTSNYSPQYYY
ncbi:MAG: transglutaminase domain-containing protein [Oscillospiraceae bacterium]